MLVYILYIMTFQVLFLLVYDLLLKKETFFNWNRTYLIGTSLLSLVLPFIKIQSFKEIIPKEYVIQLPEVVVGETNPVVVGNNTVIMYPVTEVSSGFSWSWEYVFYLGVVIATILFIVKILKILILIQNNPKRWKGNVLLVNMLNSTSAFSFLHYVFLGEKIEQKEQQTILAHELVHVHQKHTIDLLIFELLRIIFWFNPLIYMYQYRLKTLHEYIADREAVKTHSKSDYYQNLLTQMFDTKNVSFINPFIKQSIIKKRIVMLQKNRSHRVNLIKYLFLIPMIFGMLIYTSSSAQDKLNVAPENQELDDTQIQQKYYEEIIQHKAEGKHLMNIDNMYNYSREKYVPTKDEYNRYVAYMKAFGEDVIATTKKNNPNDKKYIERLEEMFSSKRTYEEHLEYLKTDKAKQVWENARMNRTLQVIANDIKNLSSEEIKELKAKAKDVLNGTLYEKLKVTDGISTKIISKENYDALLDLLSVKEVEALINNGHVEKRQRFNNLVAEANTKSKAKEMSFNEIDEVPTYPECLGLSQKEQEKCVATKVAKFVNKNFNTDLATTLGLSGRQRISVKFKIDKTGEITEIEARASHPKLEEEAKRVVTMIPKMIPGKYKGEPVVVPYTLPIVFQIANDSESVPFSKVDEVPTFPECENLSKKDKKKCTSNTIAKFVNKNFNTTLATSLELSGRQRISVTFIINKEGEVTNIKARASHPKLEEEAKRVIAMVPKMIPGKEKGKPVEVPYSLPIIFQIADNPESVPFSQVEQVPIYPGCERLKTNNEQKKCLQKNVSKFFAENFNTKAIDTKGAMEKQKVFVMFVVDKEGNVTGVKARSASEELQKEAKRVGALLPKMQPGKHKGKSVYVHYSLPIMYTTSGKE